ncbi:MAG: hypothetical protein IKU51_05450 [Clostridia bacterium]|nr:hypothetical protein [Clostridia bacterium]
MNLSRKVTAILLSLLMLISLCTTALTVTAAQKETIIIACSDYQPKDGNGPANLDAIMAAMKADGIVSADRLFFTGDYSGEHSSQSASTNGVNTLKSKFSAIIQEQNMVFTQGNHDLDTVIGLTLEGNHDPAYGNYGLYVIQEDSYREWGEYNGASVSALQVYLENKVAIGWNKPIFILNHIPLHWSNRTLADGSGTNGYKFFNVINDAAAQGLNIIYLFGHNQSTGYDDFLGGSSIFLKKGDTIEVCQGTNAAGKQETLNFTYMNAGYVGYYSSNESSAEADLTMSVFRIRNNEVTISRYSADGVHNLKSAGVANADFTGENRPAVNATVYSGAYTIAADGTASATGVIREKEDREGVFTTTATSSSEEVRGVAFKFDFNASGVAVNEKHEFINTNAYVQALNSTDYKLVRMGAVVTNQTAIGTGESGFYLSDVNGSSVLNVAATRLCEVQEDTASFAVRIVNIPTGKEGIAIYARPYYVFDLNGTEITVYGDVVAASYNGKLSNNDNELEW